MMKRLHAKIRAKRLSAIVAAWVISFAFLGVSTQMLAAEGVDVSPPAQTETPEGVPDGTVESMQFETIPVASPGDVAPDATAAPPEWPVLNAPIFPSAPVTPSLRPLGTITNVITSSVACKDIALSPRITGTCLDMTVACSQTGQDMNVQVKVTDATTPSQRIGTIMFASGFTGDYFWEDESPERVRILGELRDAGYRVVQTNWTDPNNPTGPGIVLDAWYQGTSGQYEGIGRLACRPATVAQWIFDNIHESRNDTAYCAAGYSNGATQLALPIAQYGVADLFSSVLFESGPNWTRVDRTCLNQTDPLHGDSFERSLIDVSLGFGYVAFPSQFDPNGYCIQRDAAELARYQEMSIAYNNWQFTYPSTSLAFVFGGNDSTTTKPQGELFYNRVLTAGTPYVISTTVAGVPHGVADFAAGANVVRDTLLNECVASIAPTVTASLSGSDVILTWITNTVNLEYEVHVSATPYFTPDAGTLTDTLPGSTTIYTDTTTAAVMQRFYIVRASRGNTVADSNETGIFRFAIEPGS